MLPLWIIDITKKSDRRDAFMHLVGQIDHVFISETCVTSEKKSGEYHNIKGEDQIDDSSKVIDARFKDDEKREAARNARVEGNYWYYSCYELENYFTKEEIDSPQDLEELAGKVYKFQEDLIKGGKDFIMELRGSNVKPFQPMNIVVLGDASEEMTQLLFPSVAAILQKEKGRYLAGHIHQGMNILGALYIPCNVNAAEIGTRIKILRLLKEIEVQHNTTAIRGYDNMMLYQDVQNRVECAYSRLNPKEQAEYLIQCLVHMFLACDINHPLLSGTGSDDTFYFSMGASSVYFDMTVEDKNDANMVAENIVNIFKEKGDHENSDVDIKLFDKDLYTSDSIVGQFNVDNIDLDDSFDKNPPAPHPIADYAHRNLKRLYYQYYLRYFPADLLRETMQKIEDLTNKQLEEISIYTTKAFKSSENALPSAINRILAKVNKNGGGLAFIEKKFNEMQEFMSKEKANLQRSLESAFWQKVITTKDNTSFEDYHDAYLNDIKQKNSGASCNMMKKEVLKKLKNLLSKEKTVLGTLVRTILLGIISVLSLLPILDFVSETMIDLGDVRKNAFFWGTAIFTLPLFIQLVQLFLYLRKKANLIKILKTYYTHDAYARIANRIEYEATAFYNKNIELADTYLERCRRIRNEVRIVTPDPYLKLCFPQSKFNQPLNGGIFNGESLIPKSEVERCYIRIDGRPNLVNELTDEQYFILINNFKEEMSTLFGGVSLVDKHARRFDESTGDYVFVSQNELLADKEKQWETIKRNFMGNLFASIKKEMLPREYPTIGDKLIQYKKKIDRVDLLEQMVAYSATNGELSSESDTEYVDIKVNRNIDDLLLQYLPHYTTNVQCSQYDELFQRYIFVTRWRTYKSIAYNRLLPKEDFDQEMREERVYSDEAKAKQKKEHTQKKRNGEIVGEFKEEAKKYERNLSSIILWSVSPDDNSNEWLNLFNAEHFSTAYEERNEFRKVLNQND
jgi:hypothetical protein